MRQNNKIALPKTKEKNKIGIRNGNFNSIYIKWALFVHPFEPRNDSYESDKAFIWWHVLKWNHHIRTQSMHAVLFAARHSLSNSFFSAFGICSVLCVGSLVYILLFCFFFFDTFDLHIFRYFAARFSAYEIVKCFCVLPNEILLTQTLKT